MKLRVPGGGRLWASPIAVAGYPVALAGAIAGIGWLFYVGTVVSFAGEALVPRIELLDRLLSQTGITWQVRSATRTFTTIVYAASMSALTHVEFVIVAAALAAFEIVQTVYGLAREVLRIRRVPAIPTRNIDLAGLHIPPVRLGPYHRVSPFAASILGLLPVAGLLAVDAGADPAVAGGSALALAVVTIIGTAVYGMGVLLAIQVPSAGAQKAHVQRKVNQYAPEVVLYCSGSADSIYQFTMWLDVLAGLKQRGLVLMRERGNIALLPPTPVPVVCIPSGVDLMNFDMPSVRVAMYPANVGKNIHFLRLPDVRHIFIGHGDSDKVASINPFSKVYDEIWVAGAGARERWARAQVGVEDHKIVEVGRPQLAAIRSAEPRSGPPTVLYAPTWEGWVADDAQSTSVTTMGPTIVARLLAHPLGVRVIYKPHPFTGIRDPRAKQASEQIISMIAAANARTAAPPTAEQLVARGRMQSLADQIAKAAAGHKGDDDLELARASGARRATGPAALIAEWNRAYWDSEAATAHRVVTEPLAQLYECFNESDILISDVSSVVADYLSSCKPYVVTNSAGLADALFRDRYPTASAADLLGSDCAELDGIIEAIAQGSDERMAQRRLLKEHLLGSDAGEPDARFRAATGTAVAVAAATVRGPKAYTTDDDMDDLDFAYADDRVRIVGGRRSLEMDASEDFTAAND